MDKNDPNSSKRTGDRTGARIDTQSHQSTRSGLSGLFERTLRRFKTAVHALTLLPLYLVGCICMGVAAAPGIYFVQCILKWTDGANALLRYPLIGIGIALGFFCYGFCLIFIVPAVNFVLGRGLKPWRGPYYSSESLKWTIHNGLTYIARYTFLEFITPTPFNILFYRMMGMNIGDGVQINSSNISDPSLITLGDNVTIGGSATLIAHYGMGGFLVIAPLIIGKGATVGLKATLMGGVEVGEGAKIMPNSVVLPRTKIPAGETWGGVPAKKIEISKAA